MSQPRVRARYGFTLIEMLIVITIIAMLMGMTSFAVWRVILNAKQAKIAVEIDQLSQAMQGYKQTRIQYPPCMGTTSAATRQMAFLRHITLAYTNANYGTTTTDFAVLRNAVMTTTSWNYNYVDTSTAKIAQLDLYQLDQAESLVFWLGGFPTPYSSVSTPLANRRLFGFHRDEDNPFKRDSSVVSQPLQYRTDPGFSFDETRLIDIDNDGWLEYAPLVQRSGEYSAPYVYFDSGTYGLSTNTTTTTWLHYCYPRPDTGLLAVAQRFGVVGPMPADIDTSKLPSPAARTTRWANPTGIQIICAGLDGKYSDPDAVSTLVDAQRVLEFPSGKAVLGALLTTTGGMATQEMDNQTNMSNKTLDGARTEAQR